MGAGVMADIVVPLRTVADLLVREGVAFQGDSRGFSTLLALLQSGELQAGVRFEKVAAEWIVISDSYWRTVKVEALRSLLVNRPEGRVGVFEIELRDLAAEVWRTVGTTSMPSEDLVLTLVRHADESAEAGVRMSDWKAFTKARKVAPSVEQTKAGSGKTGPGRKGRPPLEHWDVVYREIAAHLFQELGRNKAKVHLQRLPDRVLESLERDGLKAAVARSQVKEAVSRSRSRLQALKK